MIGKTCRIVVASALLALAFSTGCNSNPQSPIVTQTTTVTAMEPFAQTQLLTTAYASSFNAEVTTAGNPVGGVTVTFTVTPSAGGAGGTFANGSSSATATSDASTGVAVSPVFTSNLIPGSFIIIASSGSTQSTAIFSVTNTLTPVTFTSSAGDGQSATISNPFATALAAKVVDGSGNPVVGAVVTFTAPPSTGASGTFADSSDVTTTALTNSSGVATAAVFTANATAGGPYTVTATVPVVQSATTANDTWLTTDFSLTNTPPTP